MQTNIIKAILNISKIATNKIGSYYRSTNRINSVGESLEYFIKDVFCATLNLESIEEKERIYSEYFSYLGNQNNPPDIMLKQGDAIEVKKIESPTSGLALNSSYPKDRLFADSPMITTACRDCEAWSVKDLLYIVGHIHTSELKSLWLVYGDCYAASKEVYERIKAKIVTGINELEDIELAETNEIGRVNKVDPLGITYLRIRGMWGIENPNKTFHYVKENTQNASAFELNALMTKGKYMSFPEADRELIEHTSTITIREVKIKSPNNPAQLIDAVLINFKK